MSNPPMYRVIFKLLVLLFLSLSLWVFAGMARKQRQADRYIPVAIADTPETLNNITPATIRCGPAHVTAAEEVELDCRLINNTTKNITAGSVTYTVKYESEGVETQDDYSSMFISLVGSQFEGIDKVTGTREERNVALPGPVSNAGATVKSVEAKIDYVEFDGSFTFGPDHVSSRVIRDFREGALKYKNWLLQKYNNDRRTVTEIIPLLEKDQAFPDELKFSNEDQGLGAKSYRNILNKRYQTLGKSEIERLINLR